MTQEAPTRIWLDAQLSPALVPFLRSTLGVEAESIIDLTLHTLDDSTLHARARQPGFVIMTKDSDFVELLDKHGPPPRVLLITCGNTSNAVLRRLLTSALPRALELLASGEPLVEIG